MDGHIIAAYLFGLVLLYLLARLLYVPLRYIGRLLMNALIGLLLLILFNALGSFVGLYVALNPVTALIVGFLGIPGVIVLFVLRHMVLGV